MRKPLFKIAAQDCRFQEPLRPSLDFIISTSGDFRDEDKVRCYRGTEEDRCKLRLIIDWASVEDKGPADARNVNILNTAVNMKKCDRTMKIVLYRMIYIYLTDIVTFKPADMK